MELESQLCAQQMDFVEAHCTITGHAWLARDTGGDEHDLSACKALLDLLRA